MGNPPFNSDDMQKHIAEGMKEFADKGGGKFEFHYTVNTVNAESVNNLNQANQNIKASEDTKDEGQVDSKKALPKKVNDLPAEDFLLAFTVTLFNYGEFQFVSNIYEYILKEKYESVLSDDFGKDLQNGQPAKDNKNTESSQVLPKRKRRAIDVFGRGFKQRLESIGAKDYEQIFRIADKPQRVRIIRFNKQKYFAAMWGFWRDEYPQLLSDIKQELFFLAGSGDFHVRILAARALGEIGCTNIPAAVSEYLDGFAQSRDIQVRYNIGFILSAMIANDERNISVVFDLLDKWVKRDWRSRWTAAAAISRLYMYDAKASADLLTQATELSEKRSREADLILEPYLELNPLTMIWHSASLMFLDGQVSEVLEMLYKWFSSGQRHKLAMPDISRELFLDIMQFYFDLRSDRLINTQKNVKKEEKGSNDPMPEKDEKLTSAKNAENTSQAPEKTNETTDNGGEKPKQGTDEINSTNNTPVETLPSEQSLDQTLKVKEVEGLSAKESNSEPVERTVSGFSSESTGFDQETNTNKRDILEDKSIDDVINRLDINSVNKILWKSLYNEFENKEKRIRIGKYTKIVVAFTIEALRSSMPSSQSNPWFHPTGRKPPYQRMQDIIHSWLVLSKEDEFKYIQDPLYVIIMECYVNMDEEMGDVKLKNKLLAWHNDEREQELYQYKFIKEILSAMNQTSRQIVIP